MPDITSRLDKDAINSIYSKIVDVYNVNRVPLTSVQVFLPFVLENIKLGSQFLNQISESDRNHIIDWLKNNQFILDDGTVNDSREIGLQDLINFASYFLNICNEKNAVSDKLKKYKVSDLLQLGNKYKADARRSQLTTALGDDGYGFNGIITKLRENDIVFDPSVEKDLARYLGRIGKNSESINSDDPVKHEKEKNAISFDDYNKFVTNTLDNLLRTKTSVDSNLKNELVNIFVNSINSSNLSRGDKNDLINSLTNDINNVDDPVNLRDVLGKSLSNFKYDLYPNGGADTYNVIEPLIKELNKIVPGMNLDSKGINRTLGYSQSAVYKADEYAIRLSMVHILALKLKLESGKDPIERILKMAIEDLNNLPNDIGGKVRLITKSLQTLSDLDWCETNTYNYKDQEGNETEYTALKEQYEILKNKVSDIVKNDDALLSSFINKTNSDYSLIKIRWGEEENASNLEKSFTDNLLKYLNFNVGFLHDIGSAEGIDENIKNEIESRLFGGRKVLDTDVPVHKLFGKDKPVEFNRDILINLKNVNSRITAYRTAVSKLTKQLREFISDFKNVHTYSSSNFLSFINNKLDSLDKTTDEYKELESIKDKFYIKMNNNEYAERNFMPNSADYNELLKELKEYTKKYSKEPNINYMKYNLDNSLDIKQILHDLPEAVLKDFINSELGDDFEFLQGYNVAPNKNEYVLSHLNDEIYNKFVEFLKSNQPQYLGDLRDNVLNETYNNLPIKELTTKIPSAFKNFDYQVLPGPTTFKKDLLENLSENESENAARSQYFGQASSIKLDDIKLISSNLRMVKTKLNNMKSISEDIKNELLTKNPSRDTKDPKKILSILPSILNNLDIPIDTKELFNQLSSGNLDELVNNLDLDKDLVNYYTNLNSNMREISNLLQEVASKCKELRTLNDIREDNRKHRDDVAKRRIPNYKNFQGITDTDLYYTPKSSRINSKYFDRYAASQFSLNDLNTVLLESDNKKSIKDISTLNNAEIKKSIYEVLPYLNGGDAVKIHEDLKKLNSAGIVDADNILSLPVEDLNKVLNTIADIINEKTVKTPDKNFIKIIEKCKQDIDKNTDLLDLAEKKLTEVRFNKSLSKSLKTDKTSVYKVANSYIIMSVNNIVSEIIAAITKNNKVDTAKYKELYLYALTKCGLYESDGNLVKDPIEKVRNLMDNSLNPAELYKNKYDVPAKVYYGHDQYSYVSESPVDFLKQKMDKLKSFRGTDFEKYLFTYNNDLKKDFKYVKEKFQNDINNLEATPEQKSNLNKQFNEIDKSYNKVADDINTLVESVQNLRTEVTNKLNNSEFGKYLSFNENLFDDYINTNFKTERSPIIERRQKLMKSGIIDKYSNLDSLLDQLQDEIASYKNLFDLGINKNEEPLTKDDYKKLNKEIKYLDKKYAEFVEKYIGEDKVSKHTLVYFKNKLLKFIQDKVTNEITPQETALKNDIEEFLILAQQYRVLSKGDFNVQ